jgi:energy-coupling factor transporter ATP-binding protein EcfA2
MKIARYSVVNVAPIKRFEVDALTDVVVFAGPNGVGKTTLLNGLLQIFQNHNPGGVAVTVTPTNKEEIVAWGGRTSLDTNVPQEAQVLFTFLQRPKKKGSLKGGVLNFDSARAFEQIQPYSWNWQFADPFDEDVGWNYSFQSMKGRFQDVVHALIRKVRSQKEEIANQAIELIRQGGAALELAQFGDPILRFKDAFSRLLPGKRMLDIDEQTQNIQYQQEGKTLHFSQLSSGEREVVTVVFDFLLRNPTDCVVVFDEPELHLHPELSYRLLRTLQEVGERNQFVFCTHSPEIITAALEQTVVFVSPAQASGANQALKVEENDDIASVLRALGQSVGVISLGKRIVLIEGERNSLDKEAYGSIIGSRYPDLVLVPTGGKETISSFQRAVETVLSKTIWGVDFFMLCDGDSAARGAASAAPSGRLRFLSRYHLENYFLDENTWVKVFEDLAMPVGHPLRVASNVRGQLRTLARSYVSYAVSLKVANQFRQRVGNIDLMAKGCDEASLVELLKLLESKRDSEISRCLSSLEQAEVEAVCRREYQTIDEALNRDHDDWKSLIPGRPILKRFASDMRQDYATLKRLYIRAAKTAQPNPFGEIEQIFSSFQAS